MAPQHSRHEGYGDGSQATVDELRAALHEAQRALMHAEKHTEGRVGELVSAALSTVTRTLDAGRDERNEQVAT